MRDILSEKRESGMVLKKREFTPENGSVDTYVNITLHNLHERDPPLCSARPSELPSGQSLLSSRQPIVSSVTSLLSSDSNSPKIMTQQNIIFIDSKNKHVQIKSRIIYTHYLYTLFIRIIYTQIGGIENKSLWVPLPNFI